MYSIILLVVSRIVHMVYMVFVFLLLLLYYIIGNGSAPRQSTPAITCSQQKQGTTLIICARGLDLACPAYHTLPRILQTKPACLAQLVPASSSRQRALINEI